MSIPEVKINQIPPNKTSNEIKKMKQGMSYSCKEKTIILNVFKYFKMEFPNKCVTELVRKTAQATGCSEKSIFQFRKEEASAEGLKAPSKTKIRRFINCNSRDIKYDESIRKAIRCIYYDFKCKNVSPSLSVLLKAIHEDPQLPRFSVMTLRRLLFEMGFRYVKQGNKCILTEKSTENEDSKKKITKLSKKNEVPNSSTQPLSQLPKPTPQHPVSNLNDNSLHNHSFNYQNTHAFMPIQGQQNYPIMGPPMHPQPPMPHNMPVMHWRPPPTQPHINAPFEMERRNNYVPEV